MYNTHKLLKEEKLLNLENIENDLEKTSDVSMFLHFHTSSVPSTV